MNPTSDQEEYQVEQLKEAEEPIDSLYLVSLKETEEVYTEIIPDCKLRTLRKIISGKIDLNSTIYSDSWRGYDGLVDVGFDKHFRINHKKDEFSRNHVHVNSIESFWAFTKWRLTKFKGVKKNFNLHLKECEWRWRKTPKQLDESLRTLLKC